MSNQIKPKRSYTSGVTPGAAELEIHECGVNWADGKLFVKKEDGTVQSITLGGSGGSGGSIVEAATAAGFPSTGASQTLYISRDQSRVFRFDSSGVYIEIGN
jgi:hypothetical protein